MVKQTVILAAGMGARLASAEADVPKPLVSIGGAPLLSHAFTHAEAAGCREAVVVVGHESERVRAAVDAIRSPLSVRFVETHDAAAPNGHSLMAAAPIADRTFFLQMVDHLFAEPVLSKLIAMPLADAEAGRVLIDRAPVDLDLSDATKVRLDGARVTAIGKAIDPWDAIDAGCFVLTRGIFDALRSVPSSEPLTVSSAMRRLVERSALSAADLGGVRWVDLDTPADRELAERQGIWSSGHLVI